MFTVIHSFSYSTSTSFWEPNRYQFFSLKIDSTKVTMTVVEVFLQEKKIKEKEKYLTSSFQGNFKTGWEIIWVDANEGWIPFEYSSVMSILADARSMTLSKSLIMSTMYLSRHIIPLQLTSQHLLLQSLQATSCALNRTSPSYLHCRLRLWLWNAFPTPTPTQLPIIPFILPDAE